MTPITQQAEASALSARLRAARKSVREQLARTTPLLARQRAAALITDPPKDLERMLVLSLVSACRGLGPVKARSVMRRAEIRDYARLGQLTPAQAGRLVDALRTAGPTS